MNNNNKIFDSKNKNQFNKITPKRNFSFSKRIMNYNNKRQYNNNKSKNKRFNKNAEGIKTSLSFNNININRYSNPNITYSIENSIKDLFIKKMNDFSFGTAYQGKKTNERKINYINVNNYFNPQINIIKVNKLNEAKKIIKKEKIKMKMKLNDKKDYNLINLKKLKMIQFWWKQINKIIKIQKTFRGFISRIKLLKKLEKEEKNIYNIFILFKVVKKTLVNCIFKKIKDYSFNRKLKINNYLKNNLINRKKIIKSIKENDNKSIKKIEQFNNKNIKVNNYPQNKNINGNKNISKYINKRRNSNYFKGLESNSFNNIININKINEELRAKLKQLKNKYLLLTNKNNISNKITSVANNNKNKILRNRKTTFKSRNIEPNSIYFSINSQKKNSNNSKILTENNQYLYLTNKNIIKLNNNTTRNSKNNQANKNSKYIFNFNNNLIIDNPMSDRNWTIKRKELLINKTLKNKKNNTLMKKDNKIKINNLNKIKYYFSIWKQKRDKKIIIKYLIKNQLYNNGHRELIISDNIKNLREILFKKGIGLLIKKILNKCTLYKYFILFNYYADKRNIFRKLKNSLKIKSKYKSHAKINKFIQSKKSNYPYKSNNSKNKNKKLKNINMNKFKELSLSNSYIYPNKTKLVSNSNLNNEIYKNLCLNNSNQNIKCQKIKINRFIFNNLFKKESNKNKTNSKKSKKCKTHLATFDSNLIMQTNQLKMIFNLFELKTKLKKSISYYFNKWKTFINDNKNVNKNNNLSIFRNTKEKYFSVAAYNKLDTRSFSSRERKKDFLQKVRNNSCKDSKVYPKIKFKSKNNYNIEIKYNNNRNIINESLNNNNQNNIVYKKKFIGLGLGSKSTRYNMSNEYSSVLELNKAINNNYREDSYINDVNYPINTINGSSYGERFYKKIEEREIFFNKKINENKTYNFTSYQEKNNNDEFAINYYYKNIPKRNCSYGELHSNTINMNNKEIKYKNNNYNTKSKSLKDIKKGYFYNFLFRKIFPRKKNL